jgi:hypothetical protein
LEEITPSGLAMQNRAKRRSARFCQLAYAIFHKPRKVFLQPLFRRAFLDPAIFGSLAYVFFMRL